MKKDILIVSVSLWSIIHSYEDMSIDDSLKDGELVSVSLWSIIHSY